jgi:hypothetical protein
MKSSSAEIIDYYRKESRWWRVVETSLVSAFLVLGAVEVTMLRHHVDLKSALALSGLATAVYRVVKLPHRNYGLICHILFDMTYNEKEAKHSILPRRQ